MGSMRPDRSRVIDRGLAIGQQLPRGARAGNPLAPRCLHRPPIWWVDTACAIERFAKPAGQPYLAPHDRHMFRERRMNCVVTRVRKWCHRLCSRDTRRVAITPSSTAAFFRSVIQWLQVGYPEGVPGPDRVPLLALLRSTPLSDDEITEVVDAIDEEVEGEVNRDVIADFISDMTQYDAGPENVARVAARLAAAGWPLAGIAEAAGGDAANGEAAASEATSQS